MIREATVKLIQKIDLTMEETMAVINEIMSGETTPVQTAAFLTALQAKGRTIDEITACAKAMRPCPARRRLRRRIGNRRNRRR